jgi:hypothetical protein
MQQYHYEQGMSSMSRVINLCCLNDLPYGFYLNSKTRNED